MQEVAAEHSIVVFLEMNPLKVEFFDCETFITTIDDLIVSLLEGVNYDRVSLNPDNSGVNND